MAKKVSEHNSSGLSTTAMRRTKQDKIFDGIIFFILAVILVVVAYPLYFVVISSVSDPLAVTQGRVVLFPVNFTLDGYKKVMTNSDVMRGFFNSVWYTFLGIAISLIVTIPTAYALSRDDFYGRKFVSVYYIVTMFISGGLIPTYMIIKRLGMINTVWAIVIPGCMSVYNMMVARSFFKSNIPKDMLEAAKIDGCGDTRFFFQMVLPLSGAIIAILVLWYGVGYWNSYFTSMIYLSERSKWPLQLELRNILLQNAIPKEIPLTAAAIKERERLDAINELMKYSLIIIANIPVLLLYPFIQKHFVKGVTVGSLKG